jgi:coatomer protein complex subunit gamma
MSQYHAVGLLYQMRSHDRMALVRMVQQYGAAGAMKSPAAIVLLVRLAAKLAQEDPNLRKPMMQLLDGWLRHKSEMVNFEAAKAICDMSDVTDAEVVQAIHTLQLFLTSPRAITKFAAIRILHNFASFKPDAVRSCNPDIESLISNTNRSIATFAITTLLKTGNESSVDRLMKQISGFMADITDEFKVTIVEAIRTLCLKFPSKQAGMLQFLSGILREEGGFEFKRSVVESMFDLIKFVPESKEDGKPDEDTQMDQANVTSTRTSVRIHRGLRIHQAFYPNPAPDRNGRTQDSQPNQVHSIHLQPCRA